MKAFLFGHAVWWKRFLLWPVGLVAISACAAIAVLSMIMDYAPAENCPSGRVTVGVAIAAYAALFLGANFWPLAKLRRGAGQGFASQTPS